MATPDTQPPSAAETDVVRALLELPTWVAFDVDTQGRLLAGHDRLGTVQLVELAPDGTATPLTNLPSPCTGRYIPGHRRILVQHDVDGDERWQISSLDLTALPRDPVRTVDLAPLVNDPAFMHMITDVTETSLVYTTNRRNGRDFDIVLHDLGTGQERVVFERGGLVTDARLARNLSTIAVTEQTLQPNSTMISLVDGMGSRDLTDRKWHANHEVCGWAADMRGLIVESDHNRDHRAVFALGLDGNWTPLITADDHDVRAWPSRDGKRMLVGHHVEGLDTLVIHDADGAWLVNVDMTPVVPTSVAWSVDGGRVFVATTTPTDPGSIASIDARSGAVTLLVDGRDVVPPDIRQRLTTPTVHRIPAPDGEQVPCFRYAADPEAAMSARTTGACVVYVHGGPEGEAPRLFSPVQQALALSGFDVLVPNVRGSTGYGRRWASLDDRELRLDSVADMAAIHAWLPTLGLDPSRAALWGTSYGGYMVLAGVSMQPARWAAGVDVVGMSSLVTFLESTAPYRRAFREREYGFLETDREFLVAASPTTYLDDIVAPLFVIHGANDPRVLLSEAEQIKTALDTRGVPCTLMVFADEGHGLVRRSNRIRAYPAAMHFLRRHLAAT